MKRLSGIDAAFLSGETASMHNHVAGAFIFDPRTIKNGYRFDDFRQLVIDRLPLLPPFRRRIVRVPFGLHHPIWIEDPDFDIDYHVRRASLPRPGGIKELAEFCSEIVARPLDLSKPLWELYLVEELEGGMIALVTKTHHAAIDGVSGAELTANFLDLSPDIRKFPREDPPWKPDRVPSDFELVAYALNSIVRHPLALGQTIKSTAVSLAHIARTRLSEQGGESGSAIPFSAPSTRFNRAITPHRKVAFCEISLENVKLVKNVFGGTVNDVVLTICGTALREYLLDHKDLPDDPLLAMVPVSVRTEDEKGQYGNKVSMMFVSLSTDVRDQLSRLNQISLGTKKAKEQLNLIGANTLTNWIEFAAPAIFARAARLVSSTRLFDRIRPMFNVTISNVPGPNFPLYAGGAKMIAMYPLGPIVEGVGLNITVMSYMGSMYFGIQACRELVPDVEKICFYLEQALEELVKKAKILNDNLKVRQPDLELRSKTNVKNKSKSSTKVAKKAKS